LPAFNPSWPRAISVQYVEEGLRPQWLVDGVTPELSKVAPFMLAPADMFPWSATRVRAFMAPAPELSIDPPEMDVARNDRKLTLSLRSVRKAPRLTLIFHANNVLSVTINGVRPPQGRPKYRLGFAPGWQLVTVRGVTEAEVEIALKSNEEVEAVLSDTSFGLPPQAGPIVRARDASIAVPSNNGDSVVVRRRMKL
jgi:hypothetical protein